MTSSTTVRQSPTDVTRVSSDVGGGGKWGLVEGVRVTHSLNLGSILLMERGTKEGKTRHLSLSGRIDTETKRDL